MKEGRGQKVRKDSPTFFSHKTQSRIKVEPIKFASSNFEDYKNQLSGDEKKSFSDILDSINYLIRSFNRMLGYHVPGKINRGSLLLSMIAKIRKVLSEAETKLDSGVSENSVFKNLRAALLDRESTLAQNKSLLSNFDNMSPVGLGLSTIKE